MEVCCGDEKTLRFGLLLKAQTVFMYLLLITCLRNRNYEKQNGHIYPIQVNIFFFLDKRTGNSSTLYNMVPHVRLTCRQEKLPPEYLTSEIKGREIINRQKKQNNPCLQQFFGSSALQSHRCISPLQWRKQLGQLNKVEEIPCGDVPQS